MFQLPSNEVVQQYIRIGLYTASSALVQHGLVSQNATWLPAAVGAATFMLTLAWTMFATRLQAKVNELANYKLPDGTKLVESMKLNDVTIAQTAPANVTPTKGAT